MKLQFSNLENKKKIPCIFPISIICKSFKYKFSQKLHSLKTKNSILSPEGNFYFIISGRFLPASLLLVILIMDISKTAAACYFLVVVLVA